MNLISSELDRSYNLRLNCATHHVYVENPKGMMRPHHHNDYEIYFLVSGSRKYFIENTVYTLQPNQIVIFKPGVPHQVTVNTCIPCERQLVYVTPQLISEILKENPCLKSINSLQLFNLSAEDFAAALDYVSIINEELERDDIYSQCNIKTTLTLLLAFILRHNDASTVVLDKVDIRIQNAIDFILKNYTEPITLNDCAKTADMNYYSFSKVFHRTTGMRFNDFLNRLRIEKGCELLKNTDFPISRIAQSLGYSSENHFGITFKAFHNISPSKYRKISKNSSAEQNEQQL